MRRKIIIYIYWIENIIFNSFPIRKKKIFFLSYYGEQYGCSPKYLSEYMSRDYKDWTIVWGFTKPDQYYIPHVKKVKYLSMKYFYHLCTSSVFVTNYRMTDYYKKRKRQLYIQTWHSSLRLKMIEGDTEESLPVHYIKMAKKDSAQIDALLSGCQFSSDIFKRAFWYSGPIIPTGTPREDLFFSNDINKRKEILKNLGVSDNTHILLYAPTFRKDNSIKCYDIDFKRVITSLSDKLGGEWQVLLRLHPHLKYYSKQIVESFPQIKDVTSYDDIQELLFISDCVISDYSSLIFDYALTGRPCFLYASDLKHYISTDRALYFDVRELPFPLSRNNEELNEQISAFEEVVYKQDLHRFIQKIGSYETGHACQNVVNYILEKMDYER